MHSAEDVAEEECHEGRGCKTCGWYLQVFPVSLHWFCFVYLGHFYWLVILNLIFLYFFFGMCFFPLVFQKNAGIWSHRFSIKGTGSFRKQYCKNKSRMWWSLSVRYQGQMSLWKFFGDRFNDQGVISISYNVFQFLSSVCNFICDLDWALSSGFVVSYCLVIVVLRVFIC